MSMPRLNSMPSVVVWGSEQDRQTKRSVCIVFGNSKLIQRMSCGSKEPVPNLTIPHPNSVKETMTVKEMKKLLNDEKTTLIAYLYQKVEKHDWHGVADAAMDIRDVEAQLVVLNEAETGCLLLS